MTFAEDSRISSMKMGKKVFYAFVGGSIITLITAYLPNYTVIGTSAYGFPFPWLVQSFYPPGGPMMLFIIGLVLDIFVWTIIAFIVITLYLKIRKDDSATVLPAA